MPDYPADPTERQRLRATKIGAAVNRAKVEALTLVISHKCSYAHHASESYGCANDGSTCLCECHDQNQ